MSLDNLTPAEFTKWFQLGQSVRRMMGKGAEKYSYNGVVLPKLPVVEGYPYAYILANAIGEITLCLIEKQAKIFDKGAVEGANGLSTYPNSCRHLLYQTGEVSPKQWPTYIEQETTGGWLWPFWTNTDLYKWDGTLYLAATDPIPVYE